MLKTTAYFLIALLSTIKLHGMEQEAKIVNLADILKAPRYQIETLKAGQHIEVDAATQSSFDGMFVINGINYKWNTNQFPSLAADIYTLQSDSNVNPNYQVNHFAHFAHILTFKRSLEPLTMFEATRLAKDYTLIIVYPWLTNNSHARAFKFTEADTIVVNPVFQAMQNRTINYAKRNTKMLDITHLLSNHRH